eukprot:4285314-Pyramimonas_sp.AAC.1
MASDLYWHAAHPSKIGCFPRAFLEIFDVFDGIQMVLAHLPRPLRCIILVGRARNAAFFQSAAQRFTDVQPVA